MRQKAVGKQSEGQSENNNTQECVPRGEQNEHEDHRNNKDRDIKALSENNMRRNFLRIELGRNISDETQRKEHKESPDQSKNSKGESRRTNLKDLI